MFEEILSRIASSFEKHRIPYMIIGGQAVLLYGEPRLTRDIDVTLGVNTDHLDQLLAIVQELFLKPVPENVRSFVEQTMVMPALDEATGIRVDFIFSFTPYETQAIERARKVTIRKQEVCFAAPEDLIIHKIFAGRPRDLEDIRSVLLKNPGIDLNYIREWLKEFDLSIETKDFLVAFERILEQL